jgi:hypothetical protein
MVAVTPATSTTSGSNNSTTTQGGVSGGNQTGSVNNQQQSTSTQQQNQTGQETQSNVYQPWQSSLQQTAGNAAGNYVTSGGPPPGVTGADPALQHAYVDQYNQYVAPQIAAAQGPGSSALGSQLALGLEQLNANVYGTNLSAYQNAIGQAESIGFNAVGQAGNQGQTAAGTSALNSKSNTQTQQDWQQAMADLLNVAQTYNNGSTSTPAVVTP